MFQVSFEYPGMKFEDSFLANPQKLISRLVDVKGFTEAARLIMYAGIASNFVNKKNQDGSSWAPNTEQTIQLKTGSHPNWPEGLKIARMKPMEIAAHSGLMMATGNYYKQTTTRNANALHRMIILRTEGAEATGVEKTFSVVTIGARGQDSRAVVNETDYRISPRSIIRKGVDVSQRAVLWISDQHADMIQGALVAMLDRNLRRL